MDDETRAELQQLANTLEITIEALGEAIETQTRHDREIVNLAKVTQRLLELQRYEYSKLDARLTELENSNGN